MIGHRSQFRNTGREEKEKRKKEKEEA